MASSRSVLAAVAALLLLATAAHARQLSVDDYCQNAAFKDTCKELLSKSGPMIKSEIDTEIDLVRQTADKVKEGIAAADKAAQAGAGGGKGRSVVNECKMNYRDAIGDLNAAMAYLKGKGSDEDVNISLSSALTNVDACNTEWGMAGFGQQHPLEKVNGVLIRMISNTLSLGNDLKDLDD